jgi:hypothetical protein
MYKQGFYLTESVSNNAFSYSIRQNPRIYVAPLMNGKLSDIEPGDQIAFEDADDNGKIRSCTGLKNFVRIKNAGGASVYIFDNHNHAFYFWHLECIKKNLTGPATLIHIDQHKDTRAPNIYLSPADSHDLQKIFTYTNTVLNVGNFILPAIKTGLIDTVINIDSEESAGNFDDDILNRKNIIVDIDLDFFTPDLDYIPEELKISLCRKCIKKTSVVTVASSPFFMDQKAAIKCLHRILEPFTS